MARTIENLEDAFEEMFNFITDLPSGLDGFESDFDSAFKELRELKATLTQPNEALTLEQLREMDGQPVWVEEINRWALSCISIPFFRLYEKMIKCFRSITRRRK